MKGLRAGTLAMLAALSGGCAVVDRPTTVPKSPQPASRLAPVEVQPGWEYKIQVGDEFEVKFFFNPELNERVTVRPDGRISLQLVSEIMVAGLSPRDLTALLKQEYSKELSKPELAVIVRTFAAQRVFVGGEVNRPGEFHLVGTLTVLQAVSMAQGFKDTARLAEIVVIRRDKNGAPSVIPVNLKKAISGTDMAQDMALMPYDVVFAPRSSIANVNKWVDQYIRENIPVSFGFRLDVVPK